MVVARSCFTSWFILLSCGVKTSESYSANSLAISLSLFAHCPGGVENLRIGGDVVFGVSPIFYRFPYRIIFPFKIRNMFFKAFIPHFLEFGFKFIACSVIYSSAVWCVSSLPD